MGAIVDPAQLARIRGFLDGAAGEVHTADIPVPDGCFLAPTLVTGLHPSDRLMREEVFGPVLVSTTFRTPAEAAALANDTRYGLAASVWTENLNLALDMAPRIEAGVVWVNAANLFDAAAPFGGRRESGFGREGGWEGLAAYTRPEDEAPPLARLAPRSAPEGGEDEAPAGFPRALALDRTAKLYVGGRQARPDGGASRAVWGPGGLVGHASLANRKDVRNAVEAARGSAWRRSTGHGRAQVNVLTWPRTSRRAPRSSPRGWRP